MRTVLRSPGIGLIFVGASSRLRAADKLRHRIRAAVILLLFYTTSAVIEAQDYIYTTNNDATITITDYTGAGGAVTIPSTIYGLEVTGIGNGTFRWNTNLSSVTIPNSITSIGEQAFFQCSGLGRVTIPSGVTNLGYAAFAGCAGLRSVAVPDSVTSLFKTFSGCTGLRSVLIGSGVTAISMGIPFGSFANCTSLTNFTVDKLNPAFSSLDGVLFNESQDTLRAYPAGRSGGYSVPNSVTSIAYRAFAGCAGLTSMAIPNSVTTIGENAFEGCGGLASVTIPYGVTSIANGAFQACSGLTNVTIPNTVTSIGDAAFYDCASLTGMDIPNALTSIGESAFSGCIGLTNIRIPGSLTSIGFDAFFGCTGLKSVYFAGNAPRDVFVFSQTNNATVYYLPGTSGWGSTFGGAPAVLRNPRMQAQYTYRTNYDSTVTITRYTGTELAVMIPSTINGWSVIEIGEAAFAGNTNILEVTIPNAIGIIGGSAFGGCTNLNHVSLPESLSSIGVSAFSGCTALTNVIIPDGVIDIAEEAFSRCTNLAQVTFPSSVVHVGDRAFRYCTSLGSVTIGRQLEDLPLNGCCVVIPRLGAFDGCLSLTNYAVDPLNQVFSSRDGVLFNRSQDTLIAYPQGRVGNYSIPDNVVMLGNKAFIACVGVTNVTIPDTVTVIGYQIFNYCTNLAGVYFRGNSSEITDGVHFVFAGADHVTVYYLPGTTGWGATFEDRPTALWSLPNPVILNKGSSIGLQTNGFGFTISWATNITVVVEASTNLANPAWVPLQTNILSGGSSYFSDPKWSNYLARFYRVVGF